MSAPVDGKVLAAEIRAAAGLAGVSVNAFLSPITRNGSNLFTSISNAASPRPDTVEKVRALLDAPTPEPVKSRAALQAGKGWVKRRAALAQVAAEQRRIVLAALIELANAGAPFLGKRPLAQQLSLSDAIVANRMSELARDGAIAMTIVHKQSTVVTIIATGRSTSDRFTLRPMAPEAIPAPLAIPRDPCRRCGVRGDIGCPHQPLEMWS